jgi:uncharacterized membrane protein YdjX (TVP38/TMEM64 family)
LFLVITIVVMGREIEHHIAYIESLITNLGPWGMLAFIGLYVLATSFLLPEAVLAIIAGALFGLTGGIAAVIAGSFLAAALQFFLSKNLFRAQIQKALASRPSLAAIQHAVTRDTYRLQVLLRLTPINPATISYLLGAAGVRFSVFILACLAYLPNFLIEVYFGYAGKHVARVAGHGMESLYLHDFMIIGSLLVCVLTVVLISIIARKALLEAVGETGST